MHMIDEYVARYGWAGERLDENTWRTVYAGDDEADHDLYVMASDRWLHFAVSPLIRRPTPENVTRLNELMLRINQGLPACALAVDDDGDVNLVAALPIASLSYSQFEQLLDTLIQVTADLAHELERTGLNANYRSARFGTDRVPH
jgi:hypothetical protein